MSYTSYSGNTDSFVIACDKLSSLLEQLLLYDTKALHARSFAVAATRVKVFQANAFVFFVPINGFKVCVVFTKNAIRIDNKRTSPWIKSKVHGNTP